MTADKTLMMESVNPEECLTSHDFKRWKNHEENRLIENLLEPSFDPLAEISVLKSIRPKIALLGMSPLT